MASHRGATLILQQYAWHPWARFCFRVGIRYDVNHWALPRRIVNKIEYFSGPFVGVRLIFYPLWIGAGWQDLPLAWGCTGLRKVPQNTNTRNRAYPGSSTNTNAWESQSCKQYLQCLDFICPESIANLNARSCFEMRTSLYRMIDIKARAWCGPS